MTGPGWLPAAFAALMILTAGYCASRLVAHSLSGKHTEVGADGLHLIMGVSMAGMFEPGLSPLPSAIWRIVFMASAAWFGWQALLARRIRSAPRRPAHPGPHAVESAVMTYMLWPATAQRAPHATVTMRGMPMGAGNLALTVVLAVFMLGYTLWTTDRLASQPRTASPVPQDPHGQPGPSPPAESGGQPPAEPPAPGTAGKPALAPRLAAGYKIAMSATMSYMLITML